jgi:hypothetical protein
MELVDANQGLIVKRAGFQPVAGFGPTPFAVRINIAVWLLVLLQVTSAALSIFR